MYTMFFSFFAVMLMILFNLAVPICIGVFVYRDAKTRGMEPILWALVAALVPSFIGLIIYLIVRSSHSAYHCANCGAAVEESFAVCPQCGTELKMRCPSCGRYVQPDWRLCADCGAELTPAAAPLRIEQQSNNKILWIVLVIAAVVLLLFVLTFAVNFAFVGIGSSAPAIHVQRI